MTIACRTVKIIIQYINIISEVCYVMHMHYSYDNNSAASNVTGAIFF